MSSVVPCWRAPSLVKNCFLYLATIKEWTVKFLAGKSVAKAITDRPQGGLSCFRHIYCTSKAYSDDAKGEVGPDCKWLI